MSRQFIITGTDTGVGKTVFAAALTHALGAHYWKPIQAGLEDMTDSEQVATLGAIAKERILEEVYRLKRPASPHIAAEHEGINISLSKLSLPEIAGPFVVEGAGGLMVPVNAACLMVDVFRSWRLPVILVARTSLGTINHSLLSLEALAGRNIPVQGIAFVGDAEPLVENTICEMGNVRRLGRLPVLDPLSAEALADAFRDNFQPEDFD